MVLEGYDLGPWKLSVTSQEDKADTQRKLLLATHLPEGGGETRP